MSIRALHGRASIKAREGNTEPRAPTRYHPALVALHWLLALRGHMIVGVSILVLMLVRFAVRLGTRRPPPASTGSTLLDRLASGMHYTLYGVVLLMAASGIALAWLLVTLVALHVAAAGFHQFVRRDRLLSRMGVQKP